MARASDIVTTERLLLRPPRETDVDAVYALHSDPVLNRFTPGGALYTPDAARERLAEWLGHWAHDGVGYWAVERREAPGAIVGFGGVRHRRIEQRSVLNLAYRLAPAWWGAGYATELARAALAFARTHVPGTPVVAIILPGNTSSLRVAERVGMQRERMIDHVGAPAWLYVTGESTQAH
jgi:RimJ/RimL family protein N-acetyltransferase